MLDQPLRQRYWHFVFDSNGNRFRHHLQHDRRLTEVDMNSGRVIKGKDYIRRIRELLCKLEGCLCAVSRLIWIAKQPQQSGGQLAAADARIMATIMEDMGMMLRWIIDGKRLLCMCQG